MGPSLAHFKNVTRTFGDLVAVGDATLDIHGGEVLAILGENGAGKSTLMKLLYGVHTPTDGQILIEGLERQITEPSDAMRNGIGMVFQNFSLLPALSVRDNLLLAWPQTPFWKSQRNPKTLGALENLSKLAPQIDPRSKVRDLSVGEQQIVELCKVLNIAARIVILDEPTSVLTPAEARQLHSFIRQLADDGVGVVLITHKLADVEACADRIAVMRRGRIVDVSAREDKSMAQIVSLMMGREMQRALTPPPSPDHHVERLVLDHVCAETAGSRLEDISLSIGRGEIVGIAGVTGNGQALLAEVVAGVHALDSGNVLLNGEVIARHADHGTLGTPIGYIPEQVRYNAIVETMSLAENLNLRDLALGKRGSKEVRPVLDRFMVQPPAPSLQAEHLSGGNAQKLVGARELAVQREAILACYPTMGLDLAAIDMIYKEMFNQVRAGAALLWISEDLDDLMAAAHRIAVLREGRIVAVFANDGSIVRDQIGALMTGMAERAA